MFRSLCWALCLSLLPGLAFGADPVKPAPKSKPVDLVICLDTSGSMNGLIDSAKRKLWMVVNDLAKMEPAPDLRVGLYFYGSPSYGKEGGYVIKKLDLTNDLDEVYKKLFEATISGGDEYVARVSQAALKELKWSDDEKALKIIFVCGNEPVDQDKEVTLDSVAAQAKKQKVYINTVYCGAAQSAEAKGWSKFATDAGGSYAYIDQNKANTEVAIATPFDKELGELGGKINSTYLCYGGKENAEKQANQAAQDKNAEALGKGAALDRTASKATGLYKNSHWDLIDRMETDKTFDWKKLKEEELPEELKKAKPEEREGIIKKKIEERDSIRKQIADLNKKRESYIAEEKKKKPVDDKEKALDDALRSMLKQQAEEKGLKPKS